MPQFSTWDIGKGMMPRENAIRFAKSSMPDLVRQACAEGWHQQLIGFIQRRYCRPTAMQISQIINDHNEIDTRLAQMPPGMQTVWKLPEILDRRERLKEELEQPLKMQAAE